MGTALQHCCETCFYFRSLLDSYLGWCAHPLRAPETDVTPLLRRRELPCRVRWSEDLWEERQPVRVVELRLWGPFAGDAALDALPGALIGWLLSAVETADGEEPGEREWVGEESEDDE